MSGSDLGKKHLTNRVWGGSKRHPIDKYHVFREVCWDALGSFWEASGVVFGAVLVTFEAPDRNWGSQNTFQMETWKLGDFGSVLGPEPGGDRACKSAQGHEGSYEKVGVNPYKE